MGGAGDSDICGGGGGGSNICGGGVGGSAIRWQCYSLFNLLIYCGIGTSYFLSAVPSLSHAGYFA